jgi:hypothetical protein
MATQQTWGKNADLELQWEGAQRRGLAWWGRGVGWVLVVVGMVRGMRLIHDSALGGGTWMGSLWVSLLVTWGLTFGGAAALWLGARGLEGKGRALVMGRQALLGALAAGAALCFGTGAGGLWAWGQSGHLGWMGWVGLLGCAGATARGWSLNATSAEGSHAWWVLAAAWLAVWVPLSAGAASAGAVALAVTAVLWRLWRARAAGWSLGLGVVVLTADLLRSREVTFWAICGALCAFGALTLLNQTSQGAPSDDEALTYQSVFVNFGALLLSVVAAALCCWAMDIPMLWRGLFWPWGM